MKSESTSHLRILELNVLLQLLLILPATRMADVPPNFLAPQQRETTLPKSTMIAVDARRFHPWYDIEMPSGNKMF